MELALVIPVLFAAVVVFVQLAGVVQAQLMVSHATREVGRALITDPSLDVAAAAAASGRFDPSRLNASTTGSRVSGALVTLTVHYRITVRLPLVGTVAEPVVTNTVTVQLE